ncbi:hypothetical protein OG946_09830 [Streptomyces sp. NBC_01808]|uniref:hypothetical protein n=1 Tax=Streptomyces sp. NBC_01808 TaxID=2975947 RepID=UPI002DDBDBDE|nr:hypothetical protein [Streptomyces sp. NBC_01808]WSA37659.1 hypothetical protein OG946_09830 [Streptomyces sp. NBC_01808]
MPHAQQRRAVTHRAELPISSEYPAADAKRSREVVSAFLLASRGGDFEALLGVLDPDVVLRADTPAVRLGAPEEAFGSVAAGRFPFGRAGGAKLALVDGAVGAVWIRDGRPLVVFRFGIVGGLITSIGLTAERSRIEELKLEVLT